MSCTQAKACGYHQNGITTQSPRERVKVVRIKYLVSEKKGDSILAIHPSAIKRAKQNEKGRVRNLHFESTVKSSVKKVREAIEEKDIEGARKALLKAIPLIQRGCSKGIFHKNTSARKISRLTQAVNGLKPAK